MRFFGFYNDDEVPESIRRRGVERLVRLPPDKLRSVVTEFTIRRVECVFMNGKFGVMSACGRAVSKKKNLERQLKMLNYLKQLHLPAFAHIGLWERLHQRCIFIFGITREEMRKVAAVFKTRFYVWGEQGQWCCYRTKDDTLIARGGSMKIIGPDDEFATYCKIASKKLELEKSVRDFRDKYRIMAKHFQQTIAVAKQKTKDLKRIEKEMLDL